MQTQVGTMIINQGISEERVRSVFAEMIPQALDQYTKEAYAVSNSRLEKLEMAVIPRVMQVEAAVNAFGDPAFQILLRKAQQTAAATERQDDYELLSELLMCHVQKGADRKNRVGIAKAVEIVDDIDNDALCGLTVAHAINRYSPVSGNINEGLNVLEGLFSKLLYINLPSDRDWIDHLDVLGAVRMTSFSTFKKFRDYYCEKLNGYACLGIKIDSEEYKQAIELITKVGLSTNILVRNEFIDGFVRLEIVTKDSIKNLFISNDITSDLRPLTETETKALEEVWKLYSKDEMMLNNVKDEFIKKWDSFESLKKIRNWWEGIPCSFEITRVGTVLAHTNAKRCDPTLPDLL
ncbi:hypothetical protein SAMN05216356_1227 [Oribacterium sp. WCC10]|nr:hypothetical protein SAMN05216356_1227 [Oribacterium sp. WCC10]